MFFPTASEVFVLKRILELSKNNSIYIGESEIFGKFKAEILKQVQNDGTFAQNDGITLQTFKIALSGCVAKGFVKKSEQSGKAFYKITDEGLKQI